MNTEKVTAKIALRLTSPSIAVVGCGGAGCNIISSIKTNQKGIKLVAINTDETSLSNIEADAKLLVGRSLTDCRGTEGNVALGRQCAAEAESSIHSILNGSDIVFVIAGMGGGTGTGAAPVIADIAQKMGSVVVGIAVHPFSFEKNRQQIAADGISSLKSVISNVIVVDNDRLLDLAGDASIEESFGIINRFAAKMINLISDKITIEIRDQIACEVRNEVQMTLSPDPSLLDVVSNLETPVISPTPYI